MIRFVFLGLLFLGVSRYGFGQSLLDGSVKDENGTSLPGVQVVVYDSLMRIKAFTKTGNQGHFKIQLRSGKYLVNFRKIGYKPQDTTVVLQHKFSLHIALKSSNTSFEHLKTVVIKIENDPVKAYSDTIRYNPAQYRDGTEVSLEDLLRKLPGMEIRNGQLYRNGERITELLFNGKNVFGHNQKLALKTLSSDIVDSVEYYENYKDALDPLPGGFFTGKTALNILLKEKANNRWMGRLEAGAGLPSKAATENHLFRFGQRTHWFLLANYNNINKNVMDINDLYTLTNSIPEGAIEFYAQDRRGRIKNDRFLTAIHFFDENKRKYRIGGFGIYMGFSAFNELIKQRYYSGLAVPETYRISQESASRALFSGWRYKNKISPHLTWENEGYLMHTTTSYLKRERRDDISSDLQQKNNDISGRIRTSIHLQNGPFLWDFHIQWQGSDNHRRDFYPAQMSYPVPLRINRNSVNQTWEGGIGFKRRIGKRIFVFGQALLRQKNVKRSGYYEGLYEDINRMKRRVFFRSVRTGGLYFRGKWMTESTLELQSVGIFDDFRPRKDYTFLLPAWSLSFRPDNDLSIKYSIKRNVEITGLSYFYPNRLVVNLYDLSYGNTLLRDLSGEWVQKIRLDYDKSTPLSDELSIGAYYISGRQAAVTGIRRDSLHWLHYALEGKPYERLQFNVNWRRKIGKWHFRYDYSRINHKFYRPYFDQNAWIYEAVRERIDRHKLDIIWILRPGLRIVTKISFGISSDELSVHRLWIKTLQGETGLDYRGKHSGLKIIWKHTEFRTLAGRNSFNRPVLLLYLKRNKKYFFVEMKDVLNLYPDVVEETGYYENYFETLRYPLFKGYVMAGLRILW